MKTLAFLLAAGAAACGLAYAQSNHAPTAEEVKAQSSANGPFGGFSDNKITFSQQGGEKIYQSLCQGCHMVNGQGALGAGFYPALAKNPKLAAGAYPVIVVSRGLHGMPSFANRLTDEQIADVVNYVRTHFGNDYKDAVKPEDVKPMRPDAASFNDSWG